MSKLDDIPSIYYISTKLNPIDKASINVEELNN